MSSSSEKKLVPAKCPEMTSTSHCTPLRQAESSQSGRPLSTSSTKRYLSAGNFWRNVSFSSGELTVMVQTVFCWLWPNGSLGAPAAAGPTPAAATATNAAAITATLRIAEARAERKEIPRQGSDGNGIGRPVGSNSGAFHPEASRMAGRARYRKQQSGIVRTPVSPGCRRATARTAAGSARSCVSVRRQALQARGAPHGPGWRACGAAAIASRTTAIRSIAAGSGRRSGRQLPDRQRSGRQPPDQDVDQVDAVG